MSRLYERLLFALAIAVGAAYLYFLPEPAPTAAHLEARPAPEVAREPREPVPVTAPLQVYKPAAKKKLKLPTEIQQAPQKRVAASTLTANDERAHTVTTVLDTSTGIFTSYDRAEPRPWLAPATRTEVGVFYGLRDGGRVIRIQGQQELLQVKALRLGAIASVDVGSGGVDSFIGVGAWARW